MHSVRSVLLALCAMAAFILATPLAQANGHGGSPAQIADVTLPLTSHSQMPELLAQQSPILRLASQRLTGDTDQAVIRFAHAQARTCWPVRWWPSLTTRDDSAYHACGHAYAAALHYLLQQLQWQEALSPPLTALAERLPLLSEFPLCQESGRTFTTATVVKPAPEQPHPAHLLGVVALLLVGLTFPAWWRLWRLSRRMRWA